MRARGAVVLREVQEDRRRLEGVEVVARAINECGDASVRVQHDEPGLLLLVAIDFTS